MIVLQKCGKCHAYFSWSKVYKSFWKNYEPITCNECGTAHRITILSRLIFVFFTILPMLTFGYFLSPFSNRIVTLGIAIFIFACGSLLAPFLVTYNRSL
ncbi:TIGR04104 family putative zinc finger protein [Metabacillus mangrovi]|uniref:TIGR04104 family putative zinc finger protein n=1 Tax=Metabacillus mangrovi TaxID=1491830 RepID=UPI003D3154BB